MSSSTTTPDERIAAESFAALGAKPATSEWFEIVHSSVNTAYWVDFSHIVHGVVDIIGVLFAVVFVAGVHHLGGTSLRLVEILRAGLTTSTMSIALLYATVVVLASGAQDHYENLKTATLSDDLAVVSRSVVLATLVAACFSYLAAVPCLQLRDFGVLVLLNIGLLFGWRQASRISAERSFQAGTKRRNVLVVGNNRLAGEVAAYLRRYPRLGYQVSGFVSDEPCPHQPMLGGLDAVSEIVRTSFVDELFVVVPLNSDRLKALISQARIDRFDLKVVPEMFLLGWHPGVDRIGRMPIVALHREYRHSFARAVKRGMDVMFSICGALVALPVMVITAILIKLDSSGPILYRSDRVGRKGIVFPCYKFRTMVSNAEELKSNIAHLNEREGALFKVTEDPRVTRIGRILRKYSIDELPQFWNVLRGHMSIVGPRPPLPEEVAQYESEHLRRLEVTPGITGLWQVNARTHPSFESYVGFDIEYIENWTLGLDFRIMAKTVQVVLRGTGT